jgi:hypothetical protein
MGTPDAQRRLMRERGYRSHLAQLPAPAVTFNGLDLPVEEQSRIAYSPTRAVSYECPVITVP